MAVKLCAFSVDYFGCVCDSGIDKKKIKMRLSSKKKKLTESCTAEKSPAGQVSLPTDTLSMNSDDVSELQELLKLKRAQLELQEDVAVTGDVDRQQIEVLQPAGGYCGLDWTAYYRR